MSVLDVSLSAPEIAKAVCARLRGVAPGEATLVAWGRGDAILCLDLNSVKVTLRPGFAIIELRAAEGTGPFGALRLVYYLGDETGDDGMQASGTVAAVDRAADAVARSWGDELVRVAFDGVADAIEVAFGSIPGATELLGFHSAEQTLHVEVLAS